MIRKILFKAKRKNWRELPKEEWWVEGYPVKYPSEKWEMYVKHEEPPDILLICEIDPETLCQYIGKEDKKGNQICEHDVISINTYSYYEPESDYYGEVVYAEGWACWCIQQHGDEKPIPLCECEGSYLTEITIDGNAIDNPELLE